VEIEKLSEAQDVAGWYASDHMDFIPVQVPCNNAEFCKQWLAFTNEKRDNSQ